MSAPSWSSAWPMPATLPWAEDPEAAGDQPPLLSVALGVLRREEAIRAWATVSLMQAS